MVFDFDAAVTAPFRMQPGLRRMAPGARHLSVLDTGGPHQREKLAVFGAHAAQALVQVEGFDALPALRHLAALAATEHPHALRWDGDLATAPALGVAVTAAGRWHATGRSSFGHGDEASRCLQSLPAPWRLAALLSLCFAEDFAMLEPAGGTVPWLAVALPSHWAPERKVGLPFAKLHAPVADGEALRRAAAPLVALVSGGERWERFVWTISDDPRLHAHPDRVPAERWRGTDVGEAWFRSERQTFVPPAAPGGPAVFTIRVDVTPLAQVAGTPGRARRLHDAVATMSADVLAYRRLDRVREPLLAWLQRRADSA